MVDPSHLTLDLSILTRSKDWAWLPAQGSDPDLILLQVSQHLGLGVPAGEPRPAVRTKLNAG